MKIFVGSLPFKTTEEELQREFEAFGDVDSARIITDRETGRSRGFGFVEMHDQEQALAAIAGLNGKELGGQILKVNEARPKDASGGPGRERRGGSFGSGGRPSGGGYGGKDRGFKSFDSKDSNIYDSKGRSGGGRGRGGRGQGSGGRSGGGRRSS